jgi:hypothetical protein
MGGKKNSGKMKGQHYNFIVIDEWGDFEWTKLF